MPPTILVESIGLVAGALGLSTSVPQILRIRRLGSAQGVSRATWLMAYVSCSSWLSYGVRTASVANVLANAVAIVLTGWLLTMLLAQSRWRWSLILVLPPVMVVVVLHVPEAAMTALLLAFSLTWWPQAAKVLHACKDGVAVKAVSLTTWLLGFGSASLWLTYALLSGRSVQALSTGSALIASAVILMGTVWASRKALRATHNL